MFKRKIIAAFFKWTDGWNSEIHNYVESRVHFEYLSISREGLEGAENRIEKMRDFYYMRISNTANLLIGAVALFVAFVSLIVSAIALVKS